MAMQQRQTSKKHNTPSERSFTKGLAHSGYSENVADTIWKWYHPPEISNPKSNSSV
jgi:hypothetical protein